MSDPSSIFFLLLPSPRQPRIGLDVSVGATSSVRERSATIPMIDAWRFESDRTYSFIFMLLFLGLEVGASPSTTRN